MHFSVVKFSIYLNRHRNEFYFSIKTYDRRIHMAEQVLWLTWSGNLLFDSHWTRNLIMTVQHFILRSLSLSCPHLDMTYSKTHIFGGSNSWQFLADLYFGWFFISPPEKKKKIHGLWPSPVCLMYAKSARWFSTVFHIALFLESEWIQISSVVI